MDDEEEDSSAEDWYLVDAKRHRFRLPKTMLFLGKEECDVVVQCSSVDKRHAVVTYDHYLSRFKIKDLSTKHGTFVNESRIPEQEYVTLNHMDSVQLGHDNIMIYQMEKGSKSAESEKLPPTENMPAWAVRNQMHMAECQGSGYSVTQCHSLCRPGCIAEQKITHTCSHHPPDEKEPDFVDMHRSFAKSSDEHNEKPNLSNTWPRKKIRQQHAHIATVFTEEQNCLEEPEQDACVSNNGYDYFDDPHRLSCEQAMYSAESYGPYPTQVPACTCYTKHNASVDYSDYSQKTVSVSGQSGQTNGAPRIPRSTGSMQILPPELATIKKCTPLYGQPEWWGEAESDTQGSKESSRQDDSSHKEELDVKNAAHADRPQCLSLEHNEAVKMDKYKTDPKYSMTYMEIPHTDSTPERDKNTPPRSVSSSLSKDSLFSDASKIKTPDTPSDKHARQDGGKEDPGHQGEAVGMAFTVDFGDDKKLNMSGSLSEFVPSKIRKNFRERMEKVSKPPSKDGSHSKTDDDSDHSPIQQKKIEDIWSSSDTKAAKKNGRKSWPPSSSAAVKNGTRAGGSPQLTSSHKSSMLEEEKISKHEALTKTSRAPRAKKAPNSKVEKSPKPAPPELSSIDPSLYSDPASYLLDKMFQRSSASDQNGSVGHHKDSAKPLTEHDLYHESKKYDIDGQAPSEDLVSAHSMKPKISMQEIENLKNKSSPKDNEKIEESEEDKVSEAGTYTIEGDIEDIEEEIARKNIDEIFGLCLENASLNRPVINNDESFDDGEEVKRETIVTASFHMRGSSMEVKAGSAETSDDLETPEEIEDLDMSTLSTNDIPKWVSQWAALANQRALKKAHSLDIPLTEVAQDVLKQKTSNGLNRKRPGTGRRLPSIPSDKSPCNSEYSSRISDSSPHSTSESTTPRFENQPISWQDELASKAKTVTISSQVVMHYQETNGDSSAKQFSDSESPGDSSFRTKSPGLDSSRTSGSMDTEVLLKDTQTVMAAMEARMASRAAKNAVALNGFDHSDSQDTSDTDSNVAMVNGDEDFVKPSYFESPRQSLAKKRTPVKGSVNRVASSKPPLVKTTSVLKNTISSVQKKGRSLSLDHSVVSDVFTEPSDITDTDSQRSDISSDTLDHSITRSASKGKGTISMQKPNRAFQLRRTKADATIDSPRSGRSDASSGSGVTTPRAKGSSAPNTPRSTSGASTARTTSRSKSGMSGGRYDSAKSEVSLGAEIVKKSQQNIKFVRTDGGRHSLRSFKSNSEKTLGPVANDSGRKADLKVLKSQLKTTQGSRGLSVTGQVTGHKLQSQSQPGSRSNSPKAAERLAWKRRKEYDPRKAVADAKAKAKETVPNKSKPVTSTSNLSSTTKQMIRSSSFTNTAELSGRVRHETYRTDSVSSTEDLNHMTTEFSSRKFEKEILSRAFIPVHNTFRSDRLFHSADEDESSLSFHSTQELSRSMISSLEYKSAFTTPSPKQKTPSPNKSPPSASMSSRRLTLNSYCQDHNSLHNHHSAQSYDTLIISSIYQLSLKLKTANDRTINKLRDNDRVSVTPSPIDDFLSHSATSEIPAWKSANQELAGILKNLRKLEHHQKIIDRALFPDEDTSTDVSGISHKEKQKYFQAIERINSELTDFQSIEPDDVWKHRNDSEVTTPEMAGVTEDEYY